MHNHGSIRAGLPKGPMTYGRLCGVLPFGSQLTALDLSGEQVLRIVEHSVAERAGGRFFPGQGGRYAIGYRKAR